MVNTAQNWQRDGRIVLRVRESEGDVIRLAAARAQENVSEFMRAAALRRAVILLDSQGKED